MWDRLSQVLEARLDENELAVLAVMQLFTAVYPVCTNGSCCYRG